MFYHFAGSAMVFRGMTRRGSIIFVFLSMSKVDAKKTLRCGQVCIAALPDGELKQIKDCRTWCYIFMVSICFDMLSPLAIPKLETDDFVVATSDHPKMFLL